MALPVLDGNQSATTLSSVVTGGEHIVAHTVVSLGSTAISNITSAVSGSTVCVGNLGLLQSTVATEGVSAAGNFIKIGGHAGTATTGNIVHVSSVGAMRVDGSSFTQPISGSVTISNFPATQTVAGTVTAILGLSPQYDSGGDSLKVDLQGFGTQTPAHWLAQNGGNVPISGTVTVGNSVTIGSLPAISGTVTANVDILQIPPIAQGTSVIGHHLNSPVPNYGIQIGYYNEEQGTFVNVKDTDNNDYQLPIKGGRGVLTTRFGSVTTANTAFATSAVTNPTRHYLLIQNVTTGS